MNIPELINEVLGMLERQFYCDQPRRDFLRDQMYLIGALGTYGYECRSRGWEFDTDFIFRDLCRLIQSFKRSGTDIKWMPVYLQNAIRQHIREHAEELQAVARATKTKVSRVVKGVRSVEVIKEATAIETMAAVHRDVRRLRRQNQAARRAAGGNREKKQGELELPLKLQTSNSKIQ